MLDSGGAQGAWGTTGRAILAGDTNPFSVATNFEVLEELNTGSSETLRDFIGWSTTVAPAHNYALVLWDHGSGLSGFNFDDSDLGQAVDHLTTSELVTAQDEANVPNMRLVSSDACLMAMAEVGYSLRELTDLFVASQEVVSGSGHDYATLFETLYESGAAVDPGELATGFVRSFERQYGGTGLTADTQSAVRTAGYDALAGALGAFVAAAESATTAELDAIGAARNSAVGYTFNYLRDLGSFMASIENDGDLSAGIRQGASDVLDAIAAMGVAKSSDSRNSSGVSIFLPADGRQVDSYANGYVSFDAVTGWSTFLHTLGDSAVAGSAAGGVRALLAPDWSERNDIPSLSFDLRHVRGDGNTYTGLTLLHNSDVDWLRFTMDAAGAADDRGGRHARKRPGTVASTVRGHGRDRAGRVCRGGRAKRQPRRPGCRRIPDSHYGRLSHTDLLAGDRCARCAVGARLGGRQQYTGQGISPGCHRESCALQWPQRTEWRGRLVHDCHTADGRGVEVRADNIRGPG